MKKVFVFLVLLFAVGAWSACNTISGVVNGCSNSGTCSFAPVYGCVPSVVVATGEITSCADNTYISRRVEIACGDNGTRNKFAVGGTAVMSECSGMYSNGKVSYTLTYCETQCEADSLQCLNDGGRWVYNAGATCGGMYCNKLQCDTTMHCIDYPFNRCEEVQSSGSVYCDENGCSGLPYTRWFSEYRKECENECGDHDTQSFTGDTLITFNSSCNDTLQCSDETKCVDFPNSNTYLVYKVCIVGNEQIGNGANNHSYSQIVGGGSGSCASVNMNSTNISNPNNSGNGNNNSFPNSFNQNEVTDNCLIYGIDCPENFNDTTNYNDNTNRSPNHCICESLDGSTFVSSIICPDGSRSTFYGSCSLWESAFSSSSVSNSSSSTNPPESSSSGSENPPASSGGISGEYPEWHDIKQNQKNANEVLGSMAQSLKSLPSSIVNGLKEFFNGYNYKDGDGQFDWNRVDSLVTLDTLIDTSGVLNAIFGRVDSTNRILDTLPRSSFTGCPCITFFNGNQQMDLRAGHLAFKEIKIELGDLHGFSFCRIASTIVVAFASVVSFFIGFAIFKNISP